MAESGLKIVMAFFGMTLPEMKKEWLNLPEKDRAEILEGIKNGSLTY